MTTTSRVPAHGEDGTQVLEFALLLPLLLAVMWGLISFGLVFTVEHTLSAAAAEGARAAVATIDAADAVAVATATAEAQLGGLGAHASNATVTVPAPTACVGAPSSQCITVDVAYPWRAAPIVPPLLGILTPDTLTASATVQLSQ